MKRFLIGVVVGFMLSGSVAYAAAGYNGFPTMRIFVNGQEVQSDPPAIVVNGKTMVPLRVVSESLGVKVQWDQAQPDIVRLTTVINVPGPQGTTEVFPLKLKDFSPLTWQEGVRQLEGWKERVYVVSNKTHGAIGRRGLGWTTLFEGAWDSDAKVVKRTSSLEQSIYNPNGIYGSDVSDFSAYDPDATHPPVLAFSSTYSPPGPQVYAAYVTKNASFTQRIDPDDLAAFLGFNGR